MPLRPHPALVPCLIALALLGSSCARSDRGTQARIERKASVPASPRVIGFGQRVPKGGGTYKVGEPYEIEGRRYTPQVDPAYDRAGIASYYGEAFHGRRTANGEIFDMWALTAAHQTLPLPSHVYVTNLANGRTLLLRVNDRGPFAHERIIDLSQGAARHLGLERPGVGQVRVRFAGRAPLTGEDTHEQRFLAGQPWSRLAQSGVGTPPGVDLAAQLNR